MRGDTQSLQTFYLIILIIVISPTLLICLFVIVTSFVLFLPQTFPIVRLMSLICSETSCSPNIVVHQLVRRGGGVGRLVVF